MVCCTSVPLAPWMSEVTAEGQIFYFYYLSLQKRPNGPQSVSYQSPAKLFEVEHHRQHCKPLCDVTESGKMDFLFMILAIRWISLMHCFFTPQLPSRETKTTYLTYFIAINKNENKLPETSFQFPHKEIYTCLFTLQEEEHHSVRNPNQVLQSHIQKVFFISCFETDLPSKSRML